MRRNGNPVARTFSLALTPVAKLIVGCACHRASLAASQCRGIDPELITWHASSLGVAIQQNTLHIPTPCLQTCGRWHRRLTACCPTCFHSPSRSCRPDLRRAIAALDYPRQEPKFHPLLQWILRISEAVVGPEGDPRCRNIYGVAEGCRIAFTRCPRHDLAPKITQIGYPYRLNNARHTEPVPHAVHARLRQATLHAPQQLHNRSEDQRLQGAEPSHKAATMAHSPALHPHAGKRSLPPRPQMITTSVPSRS